MSLKRLFSFSYCTTLPSAVSHQSQFVYTLIKVIAEVNTLSLQVNFLRDDNFLFVQKQSACFQVLISSTTDRCSGSSVPFSNVTTKQSVHIRLHKKKSPVVDYYLCTQQWVSKKIQFKSSDLINDVKILSGMDRSRWSDWSWNSTWWPHTSTLKFVCFFYNRSQLYIKGKKIPLSNILIILSHIQGVDNDDDDNVAVYRRHYY